MYKKILVPLDGSREAEEVFSLIQGELAPDGQIILLKVISPAKTQKMGSHIILGSQLEEADRFEALGYPEGSCSDAAQLPRMGCYRRTERAVDQSHHFGPLDFQ